MTSGRKGDNVRRRGRWVTTAALLACVVIVLVAAPGALAAGSNDIYRDYADNGQIDGHYTRAQLERALRDVQIQGYGKQPVKSGISPAIQRALGAKGALAQTGTKRTNGGGGLPFTGFDLALMALGGAALLTVGMGFRRLGKAKQTA
jgi:hypothetical protein